MPPLFPVDIGDADHPGQSSLQLVGHTEFGDEISSTGTSRPPLRDLCNTGWAMLERECPSSYDKIKGAVRFRNEVAEKAGLGFELPNEFLSKIRVIGPNGLKLEKSWLEKVPASA